MTSDDKEKLLDLLWKMYSENTTHGRHHETQRSTVTNLILVLAGAVLTLTTVDKAINPSDIPATIFLIGLGIFGAVFSAQHYARYRQHMERAKQYRIALDCLLPPMGDKDLVAIATHVRNEIGEDLDKDPLLQGVLTALKRAGDHAYERRPTAALASITPGGLHALWIGLHLLVVIIGAALTMVAICCPQNWTSA